MTDKLTIELLCEMLEEHGLSCHTHYLHAFWWVGPKLYEAADNLDGTLTVGRLTPEQAIAATLGNEREKRLEKLVDQLWYLVNHRSGYGYAAALEAIEELGIEVNE